jgi:uncharacterized protein
MKVIDCHVHLSGKVGVPDVEEFLEKAQLDGVHLMSRDSQGKGETVRQYVEELAEIARAMPESVVPLVWMDPLYKDAPKVAEWAVTQCGMRGIKLIPRGWYPEDPRARELYAVARELGVFVQFHSGILWSQGDTSRYCRPALFETMWDFPTVRFSLAHIGWPWCDECIAVVQKFNVMRPENDQAFADLTPGTPPIYRRDAMEKCVAVVGAAHMMYGSDSCLPTAKWPTGSWQRDDELLRLLRVTEADRQAIFAGNAERFVQRQPR